MCPSQLGQTEHHNQHLIQQRESSGPLSPKDIEAALNRFRQDFDDLVNGARKIAKHHPAEIRIDCRPPNVLTRLREAWRLQEEAAAEIEAARVRA